MNKQISNVRDFHGFTQYLIDGRWRFNVTGFDDTYSGTAGYCTAEKSDGGEARIPIDENDRILIAGKRYDRASWTH